MATTKSINVQQRRCVNVVALDLPEGEQFLAEFAVATGCDPANAAYVPYYEDGLRVVLDSIHNPLTLWRPGWYRFVSDYEGATVDVSEPFDCAVNAHFCAPPTVIDIVINPDSTITLTLSDGTTLTTPTTVAAVFNDCAGEDHVAEAQVALCTDIPTTEEIAGVFNDCLGAPHSPGAQLALCTDIPTAGEMAAIFQDCAGTPLAPNAQLVTCTDFGDVAAAPATNEGPDLPTTLYGARTALLGQPVGWLDIGGKKIPYWT